MGPPLPQPPPPPQTTAWLGGLVLGLPRLTGPFVVGVADVERPGPAAWRTTTIAGETVADTLLCRLYYPAAATAAAAQRLASWVPHSKYAAGYGTFMRFPWLFAVGVMAPLFGGLTMPSTAVGATLAPHSTPFPVVVFSHGLGGMRTTYSNVCCELAANGVVVVAVEHGDASACISLRHDATIDLPLRHYRDIAAAHDEFAFRHAQLVHRIDELFNAVDLLRDLNDGRPIHNLISTTQTDLAMFKDRLDLDRLSVGGHSFGAGTAVGASSDPRSTFKAVLALDGWMFPLGPKLLARPRTVPVLFLNSETFQWDTNLADMRTWMRRGPLTQVTPSGKDRPAAVLGYIKGTGHQNQSDFPLLLPGLMRAVGMSGSLQSEHAIHLNNRACLTFLSWFAPDRTPDAIERWHDVDIILDKDNVDRPREIVLEHVQ